ncbi:MAG: hypothetical protein IJE01_07285 [Clostridia bacterium]|nr:hypothetical protein [Clostridia bacterium]
MNKSASSFIKGIGTGMLAGAAMYTAGKMVMSNRQTKKTLSKGTSKAIRAVGDFVEGVQTLMK